MTGAEMARIAAEAIVGAVVVYFVVCLAMLLF